jgi:hypothetical protein
VFDPIAYAKRLERLASMLDRSGRPQGVPDGRSRFSSLERVHRILSELPTREPFWKVLTQVVRNNPAVANNIVMLMAVYLHLGPYTQFIISAIERRLATLDSESMVPALDGEIMVPAVAAE